MSVLISSDGKESRLASAKIAAREEEGYAPRMASEIL
jgi:hypothetical protein